MWHRLTVLKSFVVFQLWHRLKVLKSIIAAQVKRSKINNCGTDLIGNVASNKNEQCLPMSHNAMELFNDYLLPNYAFWWLLFYESVVMCHMPYVSYVICVISTRWNCKSLKLKRVRNSKPILSAIVAMCYVLFETISNPVSIVAIRMYSLRWYQIWYQ